MSHAQICATQLLDQSRISHELMIAQYLIIAQYLMIIAQYLIFVSSSKISIQKILFGPSECTILKFSENWLNFNKIGISIPYRFGSEMKIMQVCVKMLNLGYASQFGVYTL